jgi:hypothetical protein
MSAIKKNTLTFAFIGALAAIGPAALPAPAMAQDMGPPPGYTVQSEVAAHPRIVAAIRELQATYRDLQAAPDDFGGNKGQAMADLGRAIHSLKRALFFRLRMDDAALDRLVF